MSILSGYEVRDNVGDWKLHYLWFPRRFDGVWYWRKYIFRRRVWNLYDDWYEYSFFPLEGTKIYSGEFWLGGDDMGLPWR